MAALKIVRPPLCGDEAASIPRAQWPELLQERQNFCRKVMPSDCRMLLFFVEDAAKADWLGFESRDDYLRALGLDPEMVSLALRGLQLTDPDQAVGFDEAAVLGEHGVNQHTRGGDNVTSSFPERGNSAEYTLARLRRDRPDLAERVESGELSANAAAIEAGFRKKLTPFEQIVRLLPKLSSSELQELRGMI